MTEDYYTGLPVWAKIIGVLGFPTFVACIMIAVFLGWIRSPVTEIVELQQREISILAQHQLTASQERYENQAATDYQNVLLRTLCRSLVAKQDLPACEPRYRGYEEKQN